MSTTNTYGVHLAGKKPREENDFYETPWEATEALCRVLKPDMSPYAHVVEPACGKGAISRVLERHFDDVESFDLIDRGYGHTGIDFLKTQSVVRTNTAIITNPPFNLAAEFISHSSNIALVRAFLLKSTFWNAASRLDLFRADPPSMVLPLTWRLDFTGQGAPTMDCMWVVWGVSWKGYWPLAKPKIEEMEMFR